jgi:hypothetical protein
VRALSREARSGLGYAQPLAENARDRSAEGRGLPPERLTVAALAADDDLSRVVVHMRIKQARVESARRGRRNGVGHRPPLPPDVTRPPAPKMRVKSLLEPLGDVAVSAERAVFTADVPPDEAGIRGSWTSLLTASKKRSFASRLAASRSSSRCHACRLRLGDLRRERERARP